MHQRRRRSSAVFLKPTPTLHHCTGPRLQYGRNRNSYDQEEGQVDAELQRQGQQTRRVGRVDAEQKWLGQQSQRQAEQLEVRKA